MPCRTGRGKSGTRQGIVEGWSGTGVPVVVAATKGDLSGLAMAGSPTARNQALLEKVEQVVRLIRSKGVGVYFISQNPIDIPEKIAGQLGNRVQHALRAFTPRDQKAIKAASEPFRIHTALDV